MATVKHASHAAITGCISLAVVLSCVTGTVLADGPPADITGELALTHSGFRLDRRTNEMVQSVTITNKGGKKVAGNIQLAIDNLADKRIAVTSDHDYAAAPDSDATVFTLGTAKKPLALEPGDAHTVILRFKADGEKAPHYRARILHHKAN